MKETVITVWLLLAAPGQNSSFVVPAISSEKECIALAERLGYNTWYASYRCVPYDMAR